MLRAIGIYFLCYENGQIKIWENLKSVFLFSNACHAKKFQNLEIMQEVIHHSATCMQNIMLLNLELYMADSSTVLLKDIRILFVY